MRRSAFLVAALFATTQTACAPQIPKGSFVTSVLSPTDAEALSSSLAGYLQDALPPAASTLQIRSPTDQSHEPFAQALKAALVQRGYAVASSSAVEATTHTIGYLITPMIQGVLLRLTIDHAMVAGLYEHDANGLLVQATPFTVETP